MNLLKRIEDLERKFPEMREMEAYCLFDDGHSEWLTLDSLKDHLDEVYVQQLRNCSLPGLDKWLQIMKEAAQ